MSCFSSDGSAGGTLAVFPKAASVGASFAVPVIFGTGVVELELNRTSGLSGTLTAGRKALHNTHEQLRSCAVEIRGFMVYDVGEGWVLAALGGHDEPQNKSSSLGELSVKMI